MPETASIKWQLAQVTSRHLSHPVEVIAAKSISYISDANRLQNTNIYLANIPQHASLAGTPVTSLPATVLDHSNLLPQIQVHIHGGAWRDPYLQSSSIEAATAHTFSEPKESMPIKAVISLNYTLSPFPEHPTLPYDPVKNNHTDPAREAQHPQHISDILHGTALLRSLGVRDDSFILSGHSCGACIAFQTFLAPPQYWNLSNLPPPPKPAAILGMNGLYDLPGLVNAELLGKSHAHLEGVYQTLLGHAFGKDESFCVAASPARLDATMLATRLERNQIPRLVVVDQSSDDQLVPMIQAELLAENLRKVEGLRVIRGKRCVDSHAAPWEEGYMIWENLKDILGYLRDSTIDNS